MRRHTRLCLTFCLLVLGSEVDAQTITGRVLDSAGQPVERAEIRVWRKTKEVGGRGEIEQFQFNGAAAWKTNGEGRFETPPIDDGASQVRAVAQAEGMLAGRSGWISAEGREMVDTGTIVLRRLRAIEGRVVDGKGQPMAEVTVFNSGDAHERMEAKTDSLGRFHLSGLPEGQICLFAEYPGYRFTGMLASIPSGPVEFVLSRCDEEVEPLQTLTPLLPASEAKKLGRRVVDSYLEGAVNDGDVAKLMALFALSNLDSLSAIERTDATPFTDHEERERVREEIVVGAIKYHDFDDWTELKALVESAALPERKAACCTYAARHLFAEDRARRQELVGEALLQTRAIVEAKRRALELARIALTLFDLGQAEEGKRLAREALAILDPLPVSHRVSWNVTGTVAEALARFDVPAAKKLLDRLHYNHIFAYELGRLACDVAVRDAALAERLWQASGSRPSIEAGDLEWRDRELSAPFCYRLAKRDSTAATRLAQAFDDIATQTEALAAVARALAQSDADAARRLASETLAGQPWVGAAGQHWHYTHTQAAALCQWLPLLETLDPQLGREFLWRAVALRPARPVTELLDDEAEMAEIELIGLVARYDCRLAEGLLAPYISRFDELAATSTPTLGLMIASAALIDPRTAASLVDRLPDKRDANRDHSHDWARLLWVSALASDNDIRWELGYRDPSRYESW